MGFISAVIGILDSAGVRVDAADASGDFAPIRIKLGGGLVATSAVPNGGNTDVTIGVTLDGATGEITDAQHGIRGAVDGENLLHPIATTTTDGFISWQRFAEIPRFLHTNYSATADNAAVPSQICGLSVYRGAVAGVRRASASLVWYEAGSTWVCAMQAAGDDVTSPGPGDLLPLLAASISVTTDSDFGGARVKSVATPASSGDAANRQYVDDAVAAVSGGAIVQALEFKQAVTGADYSNATTTYTTILSGSITISGSGTHKIRARALVRGFQSGSTLRGAFLELYNTTSAASIIVMPMAAAVNGDVNTAVASPIEGTTGGLAAGTYAIAVRAKVQIPATYTLHIDPQNNGADSCGCTLELEELSA